MGRGPCAHRPRLPGRPQAPWAQRPFPMTDHRGCPDVADVGLHLASIAPRGPRSMAACDEWLRIDFHLIDNLVNLFAESQVGSLEAADGGSRLSGLGWPPGGSRGRPAMGRGWPCQGSPRPCPPRPPSSPCPAWGLTVGTVCSRSLAQSDGVFTLVGSPQKRGCGLR